MIYQGACGLTTGMGLVRICERTPGEPRSAVAHSMIVNEDAPDIFSTDVIEANWRVELTHVARKYRKKKKTEVMIANPLFLDSSERREVARVARTHLGQKYGWWKIGLHGLDYFRSRRTGKESFFFRSIIRMKSRPICSYINALAYQAVGYKFLGKPAGVIQPDDIYDDIMQYPERWDVIFPLQKIT